MDYLYDKPEQIRKMPGAYLGKVSIIRLQSFIYGYLHAIDDFKVPIKPEMLFPLTFWWFHEYIAYYYHYNESTAGWCNIILNENFNDEEKSFYEFYRLFDIFAGLKARSYYKIILSDYNIEFHYTNKYAPYRSVEKENKYIRQPLYRNPAEVYLIELSNDSGYLCLVVADNKNFLEHKIYKGEQSARQYIHQCFGEELAEDFHADVIDFNKQLNQFT